MVDPKLNSLLKIVETGSYTKAAEALSLSQPAVSQHIKLLEEELGVRLFDRVRGELRLTREGRIAAEYARRVISTYNNLERALKNAKEQVTNLTVGITHTAESNMIVETLAAYGRLYEGMTIKVITDSNDNLYTRLRNEEIDFALVEGRIDDPSLHFLLLDT
ncbi:MAG: LysR family transcriptional regulator, partial [Lachnospiraceae bacterium]|nr:LysR family transcriptional regulator [Lachnospiraceae bacterium]